MRRLLLAAALAAAATITPAISASGAASPCFGVTDPGYVAAFDAADGVTDGQVSYPEPRWYDEQQTWATPVGMFPGDRKSVV